MKSFFDTGVAFTVNSHPLFSIAPMFCVEVAVLGDVVREPIVGSQIPLVNDKGTLSNNEVVLRL